MAAPIILAIPCPRCGVPALSQDHTTSETGVTLRETACDQGHVLVDVPRPAPTPGINGTPPPRICPECGRAVITRVHREGAVRVTVAQCANRHTAIRVGAER